MTSKQLIQEYHEQNIAKQKLDNMGQYLSSDVILHTPYLPHPLKGIKEFCNFMEKVFSAFTHLKIKTNEIVAEDDKVVVRWTIEGVSTNDFMNVPAGGDHRVICIMSLYHLYEGKITEVWAVDTSMWPKVYDF